MPSNSPTSVAADPSRNNDKDAAPLPPGKNAYIALREANIARNEARLRQLGLLRPSNTRSRQQSPRPQGERQTPREAKSKPKQAKKIVSAEKKQVPLRRSSRLSPRPETYLVPDAPAKEHKASNKRKRIAVLEDASNQIYNEEAEEEEMSQSASVPHQVFPDNSARSISIDVQQLVLGESGFLGQSVKSTGKAAVMYEAARLSSRSFIDETSFGNISFNKYCGAQEWKNDAIFLWVNLSSGNEFINEFLDGGRKITWFGGKRMHDETKVIKKLIRVGSAAARSTLDPSNGIVLWVRQEMDGKKGNFGPYHCLGRLAYSSHEPGSSPLAFVWTLLDYDRLSAESNATIRQMMQL
jgi:hypothetical protein